ncbi:MAG: 4-hydroxybenzoate octaprenyltransferase [Planctomycetes bacterium]|nr:4-hydroxybenzoate octaprenyltransferase [Planctomycetota bacterium]
MNVGMQRANVGLVQHFGAMLSLVRFSHTLFALPWAMVGVLLALPAEFELRHALGVLGCMVCARTTAMAFNRLVDRRYDATNPRTELRPSVTGAVSRAAMLLLIFACAAGFVACSWWINSLCGWLSFVALAVVLGYSLTKRISAACHWVLGAGLGLAPVGAYIAVRGTFDAGSHAAIAIGAAVLCWTAGFDILYALADMEHDRNEGLHSIPAELGVARSLLVARVCHAAMIVALALAAVLGGLGVAFWVGVASACALLLLEHCLVSATDLSRLNVAFFRVNVALGFVMLAATSLDVWVRLA